MAQIGIRADLLFLFVVLLGFVISPLKSVQICYSWLPCVQRCCSNRPGSSGEIQRWWWYKYKCGGRRNTEEVAIQLQMWWQYKYKGGGSTNTWVVTKNTNVVAVQIHGCWQNKFKCAGSTNTEVVAIQIQMWWKYKYKRGGDTNTRWWRYKYRGGGSTD